MAAELTILEGYSNLEKGSYLGAIAALATADRAATDEELEYINVLIESANISEDQAGLIRNAATTEISDTDLERFLEVLKSSELRFSLVSDVIAFAQADGDYSADEKEKVEQISRYLGVNNEQFSLLDQFTKKAVNEVPQHAEALQSQQETPNNFLGGLGFGDKFKNAGINSSSLFKGALGILGPILLAKMLGGGRRKSGLGGMLGGAMGGGGLLGGLMGGGMGGGLLGGLLNGGRGFGAAGGMLGRLFGGRR